MPYYLVNVRIKVPCILKADSPDDVRADIIDSMYIRKTDDLKLLFQHRVTDPDYSEEWALKWGTLHHKSTGIRIKEAPAGSIWAGQYGISLRLNDCTLSLHDDNVIALSTHHLGQWKFFSTIEEAMQFVESKSYTIKEPK